MGTLARHARPRRWLVVVVSTLPLCDFCGKTARYDFHTKMGPWANGCEEHWQEHRALAALGLGIGQLLIVPQEADFAKESA